MKLLMVIITCAVSFASWNQVEKSEVACSLYMATHDDSLTDYIKIIEKDGKVQGGFYYGEGLQVDGK